MTNENPVCEAIVRSTDKGTIAMCVWQCPHMATPMCEIAIIRRNAADAVVRHNEQIGIQDE